MNRRTDLDGRLNVEEGARKGAVKKSGGISTWRWGVYKKQNSQVA